MDGIHGRYRWECRFGAHRVMPHELLVSMEESSVISAAVCIPGDGARHELEAGKFAIVKVRVLPRGVVRYCTVQTLPYQV